MDGDGGQGQGLDGIMKDFRGSHLIESDQSYMFFTSADMSDCVFDRSDFAKSDLSGTDISNSSFVGATFRKTDFGGCVASDTDFADARFVGARFHRSELRGSRFFRAFLNGSWMYESDLREADLSEVWFGPEGVGGPTRFVSARLRGCAVAGAGGWVSGTIDVGTPESPHILSSAELAVWFADNGAPNVRVADS